MNTKKRKGYLRTLPTGKIFSPSEISRFCSKNNLAVPVAYLIAKGEECNWLTRREQSFINCETFCIAYNGVFLQEKRKKERIEKLTPLLFDSP